MTIKDCSGTSPYCVAKILASTSVYRLEVISNTFPRIHKNSQYGRLLLQQSFQTRTRSEVGAFAREACVRFYQAMQVGDTVSSVATVSQFAIEEVRKVLSECSKTSKQVDRAFWCFAIAWHEKFGLTDEVRAECLARLKQRGLLLPRLPLEFDGECLVSLLETLGGEQALSTCTVVRITDSSHVSSASHLKIAQMSSCLMELDLSGNGEAVSSAVLEIYASRNASSLSKISLERSLVDLDLGVISLAAKCGASLKELNLDAKLDDVEFLFPVLRTPADGAPVLLSGDALASLANHCSSLQRLSVRGRGSAVALQDVSAIVQKNPGLTYLDVRGCHDLDVKELARSLKKAPNLEVFKCAGPIDEKSLGAISNQPYVTSLRALYAEDMDKNLTPKYVTALIKAATRLDSLSIFNSSLDNHQFNTVIKFVSRWRPTMRKLRLSVRKASEIEITALVKSCTQLDTFHKRAFSCEPSEATLFELPLSSVTLENAHQLQLGMFYGICRSQQLGNRISSIRCRGAERRLPSERQDV